MAKITWRKTEEDFLIENYDIMTTDELLQAFPNRSRKSINRKLEILRAEGKIGLRKKTTVKRAYSQRERGKSDNDDTSFRRKRRKGGKLPTDNYVYEEVE
jgi:hypothetical protein